MKKKKTGFIGGKFLPLHQGHVFAIMQAATQVEKLYVILSYSVKRDNYLCQKDGCKYIPHQQRLSWLRKLTANFDHIQVIAIEDTDSDDDYNWENGTKKIKKAINEPIDVIFGSEKEYTDIFAKLYPSASYVLIDEKREIIPISATQIRKNIFDNWNYLPQIVRPFFIKKVMIVGTESCGKTTLVQSLALLYNTYAVFEYGREHIITIGGVDCLQEDDYIQIAITQKKLEYGAIQKANKVLFCDTESIVTKYYAQLYTHVRDTTLFEKLAQVNSYDLWLFLEPDVKWVNDGWREHGEKTTREKNSQLLKNMLQKQNIVFHTIKGTYNQRLEKAKKLVDKVLQI